MHHLHKLLFYTFVCLSLIPSTLSVSVKLRHILTRDLYECPSLLPGQCCMPPPTSSGYRTFLAVVFKSLLPQHIAAVWTSRVVPGQENPYISGCSGVVLESRAGPGLWTWHTLIEPIPKSATGASYIEIPARLPPDSETSHWLDAEGLLGLVWGGGRWFASESASRLLGVGTSTGNGVTRKSTLKREIRSANKGTVYAMPPRRVVYPTFMVLNGTNYTDEGRGDLVYRSDSGTILDLREPQNETLRRQA